MESEKKTILNNWCFWGILIVIIVSIIVIIIMSILFNSRKNNLEILEEEIKDEYSQSNIYISADGKNLLVQLDNFEAEENKRQLNNIKNIIKDMVSKGKLKDCQELTLLSFVNSAGGKEVLFIKEIYELPSMNVEEQKEYIDYDKYLDLFNEYSNVMDDYTNLYDSIN